MSVIRNVLSKIWDENTSTYKGLLFNAGSPQICAQPYLQAMAEGDISGHTIWTKVGYAPAIGTTECDIWGYEATQPDYVWPTVAQQMEIVSSSANDTGTAIKTGTSTGGATTTLIDTGANFTAATAVAIGDCILLDKAGTSPEFGYVSAVTSATQLEVSGGFSNGGSGSGRAYHVIDNSASTGAQALFIEYLDGNHAVKSEIVITNGTNEVATVNTNIYRVNSFRVVTAGSLLKTAGNISLRNLANTPVYSYILAGLTRARNTIYTVPAGKNLFVTSVTFSYGYSTNQTHYARLYTMATQYSPTGVNAMNFKSDGIFYPYTEVICANSSQSFQLETPTKLMSKVDIKVRGVSTYTGVSSVVLRGWLENA